MALLWLIWKCYTVLEDFFLLDSVRYHGDVKTTLKVWLVQSQDWYQVDIANWHRHVFHLQYISNVMAISWVMLLQYRYNFRMSTGTSLQEAERLYEHISKRQVHSVRSGFIFYLQLVFLSRLMYLSIIKIIQMLIQMLMKKRATSIQVFSICWCFNKFCKIEALISTKLTKMKSFTRILRV